MITNSIFTDYMIPEGVYDEMFENNRQVRESYNKIYEVLKGIPLERMKKKKR